MFYAMSVHVGVLGILVGDRGASVYRENKIIVVMPLWRYIANRFLTAVGNLLMGSKLSELHSGYRAFSRQLLEELPLDANSDVSARLN
mgnify:CR=1 FL=1|jgi:hypothetical protein